MGRDLAESTRQSLVLNDILTIVSSRLKGDLQLSTMAYRCGEKPGGELKGYIEVSKKAPFSAAAEFKLVNNPGIPPASLVPEKIGPIAYWIIEQFRKQKPELFK
jgi:hypothetical protein